MLPTISWEAIASKKIPPEMAFLEGCALRLAACSHDGSETKFYKAKENFPAILAIASTYTPILCLSRYQLLSPWLPIPFSLGFSWLWSIGAV